MGTMHLKSGRIYQKPEINDEKKQKLKCDECEYSFGQQFGNEETQK